MTPSTRGNDSNDTHHWREGDRIVLREVFHGRIWTARPATIAADRDDLDGTLADDSELSGAIRRTRGELDNFAVGPRGDVSWRMIIIT